MHIFQQSVLGWKNNDPEAVFQALGVLKDTVKGMEQHNALARPSRIAKGKEGLRAFLYGMYAPNPEKAEYLRQIAELKQKENLSTREAAKRLVRPHEQPLEDRDYPRLRAAVVQARAVFEQLNSTCPDPQAALLAISELGSIHFRGMQDQTVSAHALRILHRLYQRAKAAEYTLWQEQYHSLSSQTSPHTCVFWSYVNVVGQCCEGIRPMFALRAQKYRAQAQELTAKVVKAKTDIHKRLENVFGKIAYVDGAKTHDVQHVTELIYYRLSLKRESTTLHHKAALYQHKKHGWKQDWFDIETEDDAIRAAVYPEAVGKTRAKVAIFSTHDVQGTSHHDQQQVDALWSRVQTLITPRAERVALGKAHLQQWSDENRKLCRYAAYLGHFKGNKKQAARALRFRGSGIAQGHRTVRDLRVQLVRSCSQTFQAQMLAALAHPERGETVKQTVARVRTLCLGVSKF